MLGQGTFGQVVHCQCLTSGASFTTGDSVAVKVIKNQNAFYHQVGGMLVLCVTDFGSHSTRLPLRSHRMWCLQLSAGSSSRLVLL